MGISLLPIRTPMVRLSLSSRNVARVPAALPSYLSSRYRLSDSLRIGGVYRPMYLSYFAQSRRPDLSFSEMLSGALVDLVISIHAFSIRYPKVFPFIDRIITCMGIVGGIVFVSATILKNIPILTGWPPELKEVLKRGDWAVYRKKWKEASIFLGAAWLNMKNIPPQVYWDDPNLKILHVAALLSGALRKVGDVDVSYQVLAETLDLRSRRHEEVVKQDGTNMDPEYQICVSRKERTTAIALFLELLSYDKAEQDKNRWLAQAYIESVKLSRTKDLQSGQSLFTESLSDIKPEQLHAIFGSCIPNGAENLFDRDERCDTNAPLTLEYWLSHPKFKPTSSLGLMVLSAKATAELASKHGRDDLALKLLSNAVSMIIEERDNLDPADKFVFREVKNKFSLAATAFLETLPREQTINTRIALSKWSKLIQRERITNASDPRALPQFLILGGRLSLLMNDPRLAARKFKRGLEVAEIMNYNEEQQVATSGLEIAQRYLASGQADGRSQP